jgi:hypothetical protein
LVAQLNRRRGPRRTTTGIEVLRDLRADYGRRHDDTCKLSVCQCSDGWNAETRRYDEASQ